MEPTRGERHFDCREERCAEGEEPKMELSSQHLRIGWVLFLVLNIPNLFVSHTFLFSGRKELAPTIHFLSAIRAIQVRT